MLGHVFVSVLLAAMACSRRGMGAGPAVATASAVNQGPQDASDPDVAALLRGVEVLAAPGATGEVIAIGPRAFTVVTGSDGTGAIAAARYGSGRVVVVAHEGYLDPRNLAQYDTARFYQNLFAWLGAGGRPTFVYRAHGFVPMVRAHTAQVTEGDRLPDPLDAYTFLVLNMPYQDDADLTPASMAALSRWVERGGSLLVSATGWVWQSYGGGRRGQDLATDYLGNRLLMPMGLAVRAGTSGSGSFSISASQGNAGHPLRAIASALSVLDGGGSLPVDALNALLRRLGRAFATIPLDRLLSGAQIARISEQTARDPRTRVTEATPIASTDTRSALLLYLMTKIEQNRGPDDVRAMPAAQDFPGAAGRGATPVTKTITLDSSVHRWHSLGLWALAGQPLTITVPESAVRHVSVVIGAHTDVLAGFDDGDRRTWKRSPEISLRRTVDSERFRIASAFGGLVYIDVPDDAPAGTFDVTVAGAIESPLYLAGTTSFAEWARALEETRAPWGELVGPHLVITATVDDLRTLRDTPEMVAFWDQAVVNTRSLANDPRPYRERFVSDRQISAGYMHSGYPIMTQANGTQLLISRQEDNWGHFHELGHNYQQSAWTFAGTGEVTTNVFTLYNFLALQRMPVDAQPNFWRGVEKARRYLERGARLSEWQADPELALVTYSLVAREFGFEPFRQTFMAYQLLPVESLPGTAEGLQSRFMRELSLATRHNLAPYFRAWGWTVTTEDERAVRQFPAWTLQLPSRVQP